MSKIVLRVLLFTAAIFCFFTLSVYSQNNKPNPSSVLPAAGTVHAPSAYPGGFPVNYVRSWSALGAYQSDNDLVNSGFQNSVQTTQYVDGLGRNVQQVARQVTPGGKDMVTPMEYDEYGREQYKYLAYPSSAADGLMKIDPFTEQKSVLPSMYPSEGVFYSQTVFEASMLNRTVETLPPGNSWGGSGAGVTVDYESNTAADGVQMWNITSNPLTYSGGDLGTNIPVSGGVYGAGVLYKKVTKDEAGHVTVEYKDLENNVVLKKVQAGTINADYSGDNGFLCTYYIYDDLNQLRFVVPPKAVQAIEGVWNLSVDPSILTELCYRYEYDSRKRLIAKKIPGAAWAYMVYDQRDRQVFTQDGNLQASGLWKTFLYDGLDRQVMTGMISSGSTPAQLQSAVTTSTGVGSNGSQIPVNLELHTVESGTAQALNSITMDAGFGTIAGGTFTAQIVTGTGGSDGETTVVGGAGVNLNPLPAGVSFTMLTENHYDNYLWTSKNFSTAYNGKLDPSTNQHVESIATQASVLLTGMLTGTETRVITDAVNLGAGNILRAVNFYDDKGRIIQEQADNNFNGSDISTKLYDFTNKVLCNYFDQTIPGGTPAETTIATSNLYDINGRLVNTWKTVNDNAAQKVLITSNTYDEKGQLLSNALGQQRNADGSYNATPIETLNYTYNVRGWLKGINEDYADPAGGSDHYFGLGLSYDWGFGSNQLNGNLAGTIWRTKGDGQRRSYGYLYDVANRMLSADFAQYNGSAYADNGAVNFDMIIGSDGVDATSAYDANGNILQLKRSGLTFSGSQVIDQLTYSYFTNTNKLQSVSDGITVDTKLGDFTDNNTSGNDYGYDANGNLITDLNKGVKGNTGQTATGGGITYNYLDLPQQLTVTATSGVAKGTVTYIHDATGDKLKKIVVDQSVAGNTVTTTTQYVSGSIYQTKSSTVPDPNNPDYTNVLQTIDHEEGRIRYKPVNGSTPASFVFDYYLKDQLGDTRMVLTDEQELDQYPAATFENATLTSEEAVYDNVDQEITPRPGAFYTESTNGDEVQLLTKTTQSIGAGKLLKVMSGDKVHIKVDYYVPTATTDNSQANGLNALITSLSPLFTGSPFMSLHAGGSVIAGNLSNNSGFAGFLAPENSTSPDALPKAYLNILFFDEQFNFVQQSSELVQVSIEGSGQTITRMDANAKLAPQNGYVYVYVSNESNNLVYFDNLQVTHERGPILEETHYYPFGLTMAGISDKALKYQYYQNKFRFGGKEQENHEFADGSGLEVYDFNARIYDAQLGKWQQIDPQADYMRRWAPYAYGFNNPVRFTDKDGMNPTDGDDGEVISDNSKTPGEGGSDEPTGDMAAVKELETVTVTAKKKPHADNIILNIFDKVTDALPFVGSIKQIAVGIQHGSFKEAALGVVFLAVDVVSGGEGGELIHVGEELVEEGLKVAAEDEAKEIAEKEAEELIELHHSDPKFMGGDPAQELTPLERSEHKALHNDLNTHLEKYKNVKGESMRPTVKNPGAKIRGNFTRPERLKALKDFYKGPGAKYTSAASDFFKQHPSLK
jgi:RHS repeat-associated protein